MAVNCPWSMTFADDLSVMREGRGRCGGGEWGEEVGDNLERWWSELERKRTEGQRKQLNEN